MFQGTDDSLRQSLRCSLLIAAIIKFNQYYLEILLTDFLTEKY